MRNELLGLRGISLLALVVAIHAAAFWPLDFEAPLQRNGVERLDDGSLRFESGLARTNAAPSWLEDAIRASRLEVTLVARPQASLQRGPARLLTVSEDPSRRNIMIGQEGTDLIVRV